MEIPNGYVEIKRGETVPRGRYAYTYPGAFGWRYDQGGGFIVSGDYGSDTHIVAAPIQPNRTEW
jgi:hypothetical protein